MLFIQLNFLRYVYNFWFIVISISSEFNMNLELFNYEENCQEGDKMSYYGILYLMYILCYYGVKFIVYWNNKVNSLRYFIGQKYGRDII